MIESTVRESTSPTIADTSTKAELLTRARNIITTSSREAAELIGLAVDVHQATVREIAAAVGMSKSWVGRLLKWRKDGYRDKTPFGPGTNTFPHRRVQGLDKTQMPPVSAAPDISSADETDKEQNRTTSLTPRSDIAAFDELTEVFNRRFPELSPNEKAEYVALVIKAGAKSRTTTDFGRGAA
jgi:hypothetical protein